MPIAGLAADLTGGKAGAYRERTFSLLSELFWPNKGPKWNRFSVPYRFYGEIDPDKWQVQRSKYSPVQEQPISEPGKLEFCRRREILSGSSGKGNRFPYCWG